ncbi:MAG: adenylosuccinate synthase [Chloroflexi bacterium]|nr:adenylosuccinate synthase [Chloroflexota bacterium]
MPLDIIIGTQWGDEGKGRFVDLLSRNAQIVARFNGGDNAGHTVTVERQIFKLHLIPSGIIHSGTINLMGNGMVIHPGSLLDEMKMLSDGGVDVTPKRLFISYAAHIITPAHRAIDKAMESVRGSGLLGTTGRGIGPAYTDKTARQGLRMIDLLDPENLMDNLDDHIRKANKTLESCQVAPLDIREIQEQYRVYSQKLAPFIADTSRIASDALYHGDTVLAEGAQGSLLDVDMGTYPYVTSSSCTSAGVLSGLGIGAYPARRVIGITKAFQTRVGSGPFPTEQSGQIALQLRGTGANPWDEYGTTTGRARRVGWLDSVLLRYAARINGLTKLAITKLDVLQGLDELYICTAYQKGNQIYTELPFGLSNLESYSPVYTRLPGWKSVDITGARTWGDLPAEAQRYIEAIVEFGGVPVHWISVGAERDQVIRMES